MSTKPKCIFRCQQEEKMWAWNEISKLNLKCNVANKLLIIINKSILQFTLTCFIIQIESCIIKALKKKLATSLNPTFKTSSVYCADR